MKRKCSDCGKSISQERLEAIPETEYCANCKEIVYKGDIICARCKHRHVCRFGDIENHPNNCDEFKRDWDVKLIKRKDI